MHAAPRVERALRAALWIAACTGQIRADTLTEVQRAAEVGEFARAHELVRAERDPLLASRAEVWLCFKARDFELALEAARRGLELAPDDLWLRERAWACAAWMRDPALLATALAEFERTAAAADAQQRASISQTLADARDLTGVLLQSERSAARAKNLARVVAWSSIGLCVAALAWLARGLQRGRNQ